MYTVLLVDDEKSVTEFLKNNLLWADLGVEAVLTASNGVNALELLSTVHVDLLITDIRMPHMDGLTLLKEMRKIYPQIHCILLTAYGEFEYARQALLLGVDNYLMKPIQIGELTATIENALDNIFVQRQNQEVLFKENILRRWVTGNISSEELGERSILCDLNIYQPHYLVLLFRKKEKAFNLQRFAENCIDTLPGNYETFCAWDNTGHFFVLLSGKELASDIFVRHFEKQLVLNHADGIVDIAVGIVADDHMAVTDSYHSALDLLNQTAKGQSGGLLVASSDTTQYTAPLHIESASLSPVIARALEYVECHYAEGVSIKEFSSSLNINASYLGYLFKKETGTFFNAYVNDFRLSKAIDLICNSGTKINDIASITGFTTTSHFITTFKKKTGLSPLKYREIHGGKET